VAKEIARKVAENEKVVVFCHHLATARELRDHLRDLPSLQPTKKRKSLREKEIWKQAWSKILLAAKKTGDLGDEHMHAAALRFTTETAFHAQASAWLDPDVDQRDCRQLVRALKTTRIRNMPAKGHAPTIVAAVIEMAQWESHDEQKELPKALLVHTWSRVTFPQSDDVAGNLAMFSTPFGPDVLVATDKFSEGIDLHRYCRIMVHYELDPSPVRIRQREGRVRRVNSWAARIQKPVLYAYPAYGSTRDEVLVRIMRQRLERFDILLGGAPAVTAEDTEVRVTSESKLLQAMRAQLKERIHTCLNDWR
jgi:hypothetical protein